MRSRSIRSRAERLRCAAALVALVAGVAVHPGAPAADTASAQVKEAQGLYKKGEAAFKAERWSDAIGAWEQGYLLVPKPLFIINMAHAERKRGELRKALALYKRFLVVDPETPLRAEVESVVKDLEDAIAAEDAARLPRGSLVPPVLAPEPVAPTSAPVVAASRDARPPVYQRWWFWTAAGAVLVGAVIGVALATSGSDHQESGSLGTLRGALER